MTAFNFSLLQEKQGKFDEALRLAEEATAAARVSLPEGNAHRRQYEQQFARMQAKLNPFAPSGP